MAVLHGLFPRWITVRMKWKVLFDYFFDPRTCKLRKDAGGLSCLVAKKMFETKGEMRWRFGLILFLVVNARTKVNEKANSTVTYTTNCFVEFSIVLVRRLTSKEKKNSCFYLLLSFFFSLSLLPNRLSLDLSRSERFECIKCTRKTFFAWQTLSMAVFFEFASTCSVFACSRIFI